MVVHDNDEPVSLREILGPLAPVEVVLMQPERGKCPGCGKPLRLQIRLVCDPCNVSWHKEGVCDGQGG